MCEGNALSEIRKLVVCLYSSYKERGGARWGLPMATGSYSGLILIWACDNKGLILLISPRVTESAMEIQVGTLKSRGAETERMVMLPSFILSFCIPQ